MGKRLGTWFIQWPWVDGALALVAACAVGVFHPHIKDIGVLVSIFTSLSTVITISGGLGSVAISAASGGPGRITERLAGNALVELRRSWYWGFCGSIGIAMTSWVATILAATRSFSIAWALAAWCGSAAVLIGVRLSWISVQCAGISSGESSKRHTAEVPVVVPRSTRRDD